MRQRRVRAIARKEFLQIWRDPRSLMLALLMPFLQMALLGYGLSLDIKNVSLCAFDREGGPRSQALLKHFQATSYFHIVEVEPDCRSTTEALDYGRCVIAIVVPRDFGAGAARRHRRQYRADRAGLGAIHRRRLLQ